MPTGVFGFVVIVKVVVPEPVTEVGTNEELDASRQPTHEESDWSRERSQRRD